MIVAFADIDEFMIDLEDAHGANRVADNLVRTTTERLSANGGCVVTFYAAFNVLGLAGDELRVFSRDCGADFEGLPPAGSAQADAIKDQIGRFCDSHGLLLRGGRFTA